VTAGYGWAFVIDAITYLAVIGAIAMMRRTDLSQPPRTLRAKGQIRAGLSYVHGVPDLWVPLVMMTIVGTLTFNFSVVLPLFAERTLHGSDTTYTLLYSVLSVGSLGGALITARLRSITITHLVIASVAFGAAMLALAATPNAASAFPVAVLVGLTSIAFMASSTAIVQVRADPAMRGRVLALQAMVFIGSTPIGGPILGAICDRYGARSGLIIGGVAALATGVYDWAARHREEGDEQLVPDGDAAVAIDHLAHASTVEQP
jgi:predicted MFS family arabinose efflux permease